VAMVFVVTALLFQGDDSISRNMYVCKFKLQLVQSLTFSALNQHVDYSGTT